MSYKYIKLSVIVAHCKIFQNFRNDQGRLFWPGFQQSEQIHCSAIASAIPWYVIDRRCPLFGEGGIRCILFSLPETIFVGISFGKFLSHRQVAFVSPCPNCQGWMIWSGFMIISLACLCCMGFSTATMGISLLRSMLKNSAPFLMLSQRFSFCQNYITI